MTAELPLPPDKLHHLLRRVLADGEPVTVRTAGSSMSPFILQGDLITIAPLGDGSIDLGTVVAFLRDGRHLIVHRVVGRDSAGYLTRGDALRHADGTVAAAEIFGKVVRVTRGKRRIRLGLGPERRAIAALSRSGALALLVEALHPLTRLVRRRKEHPYIDSVVSGTGQDNRRA